MIDITLYGTAPQVLKTNGKYCDQDITVRNRYDVIEVTPTKQEQVEMPKIGYSGIGRATIKPIPDEYIIPTGDKNITENGTVDITKFKNVVVNVQPKLKRKTITFNGIYTAKTDSVDGYDEVEVSVTGDDPNAYRTSVKEYLIGLDTLDACNYGVPTPTNEEYEILADKAMALFVEINGEE